MVIITNVFLDNILFSPFINYVIYKSFKINKDCNIEELHITQFLEPLRVKSSFAKIVLIKIGNCKICLLTPYILKDTLKMETKQIPVVQKLDEYKTC